MGMGLGRRRLYPPIPYPLPSLAQVGGLCIPRNRDLGDKMLMKDYFAEVDIIWIQTFVVMAVTVVLWVASLFIYLYVEFILVSIQWTLLWNVQFIWCFMKNLWCGEGFGHLGDAFAGSVRPERSPHRKNSLREPLYAFCGPRICMIC